MGINVQNILSFSLYPFCRYRNELEDKCLYPTRIFESKLLHPLVLHNGLIEIVYECCQQKKHRILGHERFGQIIPTKLVVHIVEYTFLAFTFVIKFHNLPAGRCLVICQNTSVRILSLPNVKCGINTFLSLNDKTAGFSFPFLDKNGIQFYPNTIDLFRFPASQCKNIIIKGRTPVCTYIVMPAMTLYYFNYIFRT